MVTRSAEYKIKQLAKQNERRRANPEKYKEMGRKSERKRRMARYGITEEQYDALMVKQSYRCRICTKPLVEGRFCHIDHSHTTGKVRGLLCHHCNVMLGLAKDDSNILQQAINYLKDNP